MHIYQIAYGMFSPDLLLEVIMETFYENMRKRILLKVNISADSNCWIWAGGLDSKKKYGRIGYVDPVSGDSKRKNVSREPLHGFSQRMGCRSWIRLFTLVP